MLTTFLALEEENPNSHLKDWLLAFPDRTNLLVDYTPQEAEYLKGTSLYTTHAQQKIIYRRSWQDIETQIIKKQPKSFSTYHRPENYFRILR